jgi:C4-type Zn-finger protein
MAQKLRCNSCQGTYTAHSQPGDITYFHACPDEVIETHAVCDEKGDTVTPATFRRVENPRNENLKPNPEKPGEYVMISEGSGVTEIE